MWARPCVRRGLRGASRARLTPQPGGDHPMKRHIAMALAPSALLLAIHAGPALADTANDLRDEVRELTDRVNELEGRGHVNLPAGTTLTFGGYTKLDLIYDLDQGQGDTTFVPGLAVGAPDGGGFDAHVRQTRLNFRTDTQTETGPLTTFVEIDFFGTRANEVFSNSHRPRLRHAYGRWNGWTAGQTWTTFMPIEAYPATVDFQGPSGIPFIRQAQLRYTFAAGDGLDLTVAIENGESPVVAWSAARPSPSAKPPAVPSRATTPISTRHPTSCSRPIGARMTACCAGRCCCAISRHRASWVVTTKPAGASMSPAAHRSGPAAGSWAPSPTVTAWAATSSTAADRMGSSTPADSSTPSNPTVPPRR